jgi:uncharacterized protein (TIGR03435 family)
MTRPAGCRLDLNRKLLFLAAAASITLSTAIGQTNAAPSGSTPQAENTAATLPVYDVVSIKPNKSGSGSLDVETHSNTYSATNISLKKLLENAYGIKEDLISGLSGPIASARFDIEAKIVEPDPDALKKLSPNQRDAMLLPFLKERFQLKAHTETKTLPIYELIVIKGGPKFKQSSGDSTGNRSTNIHNRELTAHDIAMGSFASTLEGQVHRTVIDKTGLEGSYDLTLKWSPDDATSTQTDSAPAIFTALQEQLGLKLQPAKGPVQTLVVDHAEMPSEN